MAAGSQEQDRQTALNMLAQLLPQTDLPQAGWSVKQALHREVPHKRRLVLILGHANHADIVLKQVFHPLAEKEFKDTLEQQLDLQDRLRGVPRVFAHDLAAQTVLMQRLPGETLFKLCEARPLREHGALLQVAGRWLADFHRVDGTEPRQFQPRFTTDHFASMVRDIEQGKTQIAGANKFIPYAGQLQAEAPQGAACATLAGRCHGDFSCNNIMIDADQGFGLDFMQKKTLPVAYDIARLLVHYAVYRPKLTQSQGLLPGVETDGFFRGYDLIGPDDQTLALLLRARLLNEWARIPRRQHQRSLAEQIRYRRIQRLCKRVFA